MAVSDFPRSTPTEHGTFLVDCDCCAFVYRSFQVQWLLGLACELSEAISVLVGDVIKDERLKKKCSAAPHGPHFPCIIGRARKYQRVSPGQMLLLTTFEGSPHAANQLPELTAFHKNNAAKVKASQAQQLFKE
jgi:hypothetical protein